MLLLWPTYNIIWILKPFIGIEELEMEPSSLGGRILSGKQVKLIQAQKKNEVGY